MLWWGGREGGEGDAQDSMLSVILTGCVCCGEGGGGGKGEGCIVVLLTCTLWEGERRKGSKGGCVCIFKSCAHTDRAV